MDKEIPDKNKSNDFVKIRTPAERLLKQTGCPSLSDPCNKGFYYLSETKERYTTLSTMGAICELLRNNLNGTTIITEVIKKTQELYEIKDPRSIRAAIYKLRPTFLRILPGVQAKRARIIRLTDHGKEYFALRDKLRAQENGHD